MEIAEEGRSRVRDPRYAPVRELFDSAGYQSRSREETVGDEGSWPRSVELDSDYVRE